MKKKKHRGGEMKLKASSSSSPPSIRISSSSLRDGLGMVLLIIISSSVSPFPESCGAQQQQQQEEGSTSTSPTPTPSPWPYQFHSKVISHLSGALQLVDLWYDWPNGRNLNIEQDQLGKLLYNIEWTNGTSFFFYPLEQVPTCSIAHFDVGILRPNWMEGGNYLGQRHVDGFLCNVWDKADNFIQYYEDVITKKPVHWLLFTGKESEIMTFEVGAVLEDSKWQAPPYCFLNSSSLLPPQLLLEKHYLLSSSTYPKDKE